MTISLFALVLSSTPATVGALAQVVTAVPFGVGKGLGVLIVVSALLLAAMALGGHLGAASKRRKNRDKLD